MDVQSNELGIASLGKGLKYRLRLAIDDKTWLPILVIKGRFPGKTLAVTANIHGDEYEGVRAIFEVFDALDPAVMSGDLIAVPVANPPAFWRGTRLSPVDELNLARIFPGNAAGTLSEKIACALAHSVISQADFYLDLHSGGISYNMPSMAGYCFGDARGRAAAMIFGSRVIWGHDEIAAGRTISYAHSTGVPWLYTEAGGGGRIRADDLGMMTQGIQNLLAHLEILPGPIRTPEIKCMLRGEGNTDLGISASHDGFLLLRVELLQQVARGDLLGLLVNVLGEPLEEYRAPRPGIVALIREFPMIKRGNSIFLIADRE